MATAPVKPHPLHNFPLSLKWGQATAVTTAEANHHRNSDRPVAKESEAQSDPVLTTRPSHRHRIGSRTARLHRSSYGSGSNINAKPGKQPIQTTTVESEISEKRRKQGAVEESSAGAGADVDEGEEMRKQDEQEGNSRPWKLRPRRRFFGVNYGEELTEAMLANEQGDRENTQQLLPKSMRLRGLVECNGGGGEGFRRNDKRKFWIALSREEIEEDIFIVTGSRPSRRPRKRPRNVQKVLDAVFPGLWLVGATIDSYRVADAPAKK